MICSSPITTTEDIIGFEGLPLYLRNALSDFLIEMKKSEQGEDCMLDVLFGELQSCINVAEVEQEISSDFAWELRRRVLRLEVQDD